MGGARFEARAVHFLKTIVTDTRSKVRVVGMRICGAADYLTDVLEPTLSVEVDLISAAAQGLVAWFIAVSFKKALTIRASASSPI